MNYTEPHYEGSRTSSSVLRHTLKILPHPMGRAVAYGLPAGSIRLSQAGLILAATPCTYPLFREAMERCKPVILEPIMAVEVVTPEEYLGSVIGDLNGRRGQIQGQDMRGNATVINAFVPLANMFGYVNTLRGMSQGRAQFTMQYDHYEPVPQHVADEVIKKYA